MRRPTPPAYGTPAPAPAAARLAMFGWLGAVLSGLLFWAAIIIFLAVMINLVSGGLVLIIIGRHL